MNDHPNQPTALVERLDINLVLQAAGLGIWEVDPETNHVLFDERCREFFGFAADTPLSFEAAIQGIHPEDRDRVTQAIAWAINPQSDGSYDQQYRTVGVDDGRLRWVHFRGRGYFTPAGKAYRFAGIGQDVTERVVARQELEESEQFSRIIFHTSPVAKLVYVGHQMILREANEKMLVIFGRDASIIGQPVMEAIPELRRTQLLDNYHRVLATGQTVEEKAARIELSKDDQAYWGYYDYTYKPLFDLTGKAYGVICTAMEVTQEVLARHKMEEAQASLQGALELAQLGTWSVDIATGVTLQSQRHADMFGFDKLELTYEEALSVVHSDDRQRVQAAFERAMQPGSDGHYQAEYRIKNARSGKLQFIRARGETSFDAQANPMSISGTAQDVTLERELQISLEQQVQQRTEELDAANEELTASNEELLASHEEMATANTQLNVSNDLLNESNYLLNRSNENLQQFAYVASHDLQEPLRKIQSFGQLLKDQHGEHLGEGIDYLRRMQDAASRMSILIQDLLAYSRIATQQENRDPVFLDTVVREVLLDLDMVIGETKAQVTISSLPVVMGDTTQLKQLFQNLLSNALKFRQPGVAPHIRVSSRLLEAGSLPPEINEVRSASSYYRLDVVDNGIGFDQKYADRIFQVFQRLHGKSHYAGTGIGLAICEKVATNHGGAITATSRLGQGATFSVYLPV